MGDGSRAVLLDPNQRLAVLEALRVAPLLELDDEVGRPAGLRMAAGEDDVGTFARERELVLDHHLDVVESRRDEVGPQRRDAALPRAAFSGTWPLTGTGHHLLGDEVGEVVLDRGEAANRLSVERHR